MASTSYAQRTTAFVTIMFYILQDNTIHADKIFTILQYFSALQWTMAFLFPRALQHYAEAKVSIKRIQVLEISHDAVFICLLEF